ILDEVSMIDMPLFYALLDALPEQASLIMIGDSDQLPSVGPGNLLKDLIAGGAIKTVYLKEIFRQAQQSMIVMNAHAINTGRMPSLDASNDFFFMRRNSAQDLITTVKELCRTRLPSYFDIEPSQIQVIMPSKLRETGTYNLNNQLQTSLNPGRPGVREYRFGDMVFREGDKVMQIRNNYDITWHKSDMSEAGWGIFNGDIGIIERISIEEEIIEINFDDRITDYSLDLVEDLELAYAMTVHKSQGSEFEAVVFVAFDAPARLLTRNILYTAVTRAKRVFVAVGKDEIIWRMTQNNDARTRYSGLKERIKLLRGSGNNEA
ncbi:MAG: AAA family ATPase, partial [Clostridiales bacterium]|nr:AAA family ATPase [Clostridiales bacterium]